MNTPSPSGPSSTAHKAISRPPGPARPELARPELARVEALFMAALEHPTERRDAWLATACAGDERLYAEVAALLAEDAIDDPDHLRSPAERLHAEDELTVGNLIAGRYRVAERLGSGGLGVVHRADQLAPVQRPVALKVGRRGLDDTAALALFQAESRALSQMNHPGIAQVYDAGRTEGGRFFVAMELVEGVPLTDYCAHHRLELPARLRLFVDVCRAVQHAHQRGVIHRDLKPSNVLVTRHGQLAFPKVIDFGIAQMSGTDLDDAHGPLAGTPAYMSPEQATDSLADIDTRADVYSLGVMLYELLTGTLPFSSRASTRHDLLALHEALRLPLDPPSRRVLTTRTRRDKSPVVPPVASTALRGDLDAIVAKAMAFDRSARYASVSELAADIERALTGHPVSARPQTFAYLARTFVRRHRLLVVSSIVLLIGATIAAAVMVRLSSEEAEQRRIAEREAATAAASREVAERTSRLADRLQARSLLSAAAAALSSGDAGTTRANLDAIPTSHRGWEWHHLHLEADKSEHTLHSGGSAISTLAIASAAPRLAAGDTSGRVHTFDIAPDVPRASASFVAHESEVAGLALSPDGRRLATTDLKSATRVWDLETGTLLWQHPGTISLARGAFSPDGTRIAFGVFGDFTVAIHDAESGAELDRLPIATPTAYRPTWVGMGDLLVTDLSRTMRIDASRAEVRWVVPARMVTNVGPDHFLARSLPNYVGWSLYDADTGLETKSLIGPVNQIEVLDVSPDGANVANSPASTALALTTLADGTPEALRIQSLPGHDGAITAIVFGPGDRFFVGDSLGAVKVWSTETLPQPFVAPRSNDVIYSGLASADGAVVVTGGWGAVKCWDAALGVERWTRLVGRAYLASVAIAPDGARVAVGDWRGTVRVLDLEDGDELARVDVGVVRVVALAWAPDGRLVVGREDGRLDVVDLAHRKVDLSVEAHGSAIRTLAFDPAGGLMASGSGDGAVWPAVNEERPDQGSDATVRLWRWPGLEPVVVMAGHEASVRSLAFSPDGARLVSGGSDRTVRAWSVPDGTALATRIGVGLEVSALGFSVDGSRLVTAHAEGPLLVWDAVELELLTSLGGGRGHVVWAGFTSDGQSLTAVSRKNAIIRFQAYRDRGQTRALLETQAARAVLDHLDGIASTQTVAEQLILRDDLVPAVAQRAAAMVQARGDHILMLNSAAWGQVLTPGQPAPVLTRALAESSIAVQSSPQHWHLWNTLSLARYRMGDLEGALAASMRCEELQQAAGATEHPVDDIIRAMILAALNRNDEAEALLESVRPKLERDPFRLDHEVWGLIAEADALVGATARRHEVDEQP